LNEVKREKILYPKNHCVSRNQTRAAVSHLSILIGFIIRISAREGIKDQAKANLLKKALSHPFLVASNSGVKRE
jgi:hypothetical protein